MKKFMKGLVIGLLATSLVIGSLPRVEAQSLARVDLKFCDEDNQSDSQAALHVQRAPGEAAEVCVKVINYEDSEVGVNWHFNDAFIYRGKIRCLAERIRVGLRNSSYVVTENGSEVKDHTFFVPAKTTVAKKLKVYLGDTFEQKRYKNLSMACLVSKFGPESTSVEGSINIILQRKSILNFNANGEY